MYFQLFYTFSQTLNNSSSNLLKLTMKKNQLPKDQVEFQNQKKKKKKKKTKQYTQVISASMNSEFQAFIILTVSRNNCKVRKVKFIWNSFIQNSMTPRPKPLLYPALCSLWISRPSKLRFIKKPMSCTKGRCSSVFSLIMVKFPHFLEPKVLSVAHQSHHKPTYE